MYSDRPTITLEIKCEAAGMDTSVTFPVADMESKDRRALVNSWLKLVDKALKPYGTTASRKVA